MDVTPAVPWYGLPGLTVQVSTAADDTDLVTVTVLPPTVMVALSWPAGTLMVAVWAEREAVAGLA
ncbi:hypothetical protein GCM10022284_74220 [Streptomyces hundungensis]